MVVLIIMKFGKTEKLSHNINLIFKKMSHLSNCYILLYKIISRLKLNGLSAFSFITILSLTSCHKEMISQSIDVSSGTAGVAAYPFDWDNTNTNFMPVPSSLSIQIPVPWANGAVRGFSTDILYDYKKNDGWELVYNVFNTTSLPNNPWFSLYNRYRGLLRIYVYTTSTGFPASSYCTSGLNLGPNNNTSPLLNYTGQDLVNFNIKQSNVSIMEPTQMAQGVWYCSQYEMAYDQTATTTTFQQLGLNWTLKYSNVATVSLGGTQVGSLNGTITTPASGGFDFGGNLFKGTVNVLGAQAVIDGAGTKTVGHPEVENKLGLPESIYKNIASIFTTGNAIDIGAKIFSAIFGGGSASPTVQTVNLTMNTNIQLTGNITSGGALIPSPGLGFGIPGLSNSQTAQGYIPSYNNPMGIFYISAKPKVYTYASQVMAWNYNAQDYIDNAYEYYLSGIDQSSFSLVFNPSVINSTPTGAQIQNIKYEMVKAVVANNGQNYNPQTENYDQIGIYSVITSKTPPNAIWAAWVREDAGASGSPSDLVGWGIMPCIRVSFDVVPNNSSATFRIVKTFLADPE